MLSLARLALLASALLSTILPSLASTDPSFHLPLLGVVPSSSLDSPIPHHRFQAVGKGANILVLATESNLLAGVHPQSGQIAWRRRYEDATQPVRHAPAGEGAILAWSTPDAVDLHAVSSTTGKLLWRVVPDEDACKGEEAEVHFAAREESRVVVRCGELARGFDGETGELKWSERASSSLLGAAVNDEHLVFFTLRDRDLTSRTIAVATGAAQNTPVNFGRKMARPFAEVFPLSVDSSHLALVWEQDGALMGTIVSQARRGDPTSATTGANLAISKLTIQVGKLVDAGLAKHGVLVALDQAGKTAVVLSVAKNLHLEQVGSFPIEPSTAISSYVDHEGGVHLAFLDYSRVLQFGSLQIWSRTRESPQGVISAHSFPIAKEDFDAMRGFALQVLPLRSPEQPTAPALSRIALATNTGLLQLWEGDRLKWKREDGLATADIGPVAVHDLLVGNPHFQPSDADTLPAFLFASSETQAVFAVTPRAGTFDIKWQARLGGALRAGSDVRVRGLEAAVVPLYEGQAEGELATLLRVVVEESGEDAIRLTKLIHLDIATGKVLSPLEPTSNPDAPAGVTIESVDARTLVGRTSRSSEAWTFTLPPSLVLQQVTTQAPPLPQAGPSPHSSTTLVAALASSPSNSTDTTLFLLDAATGGLLQQLKGQDAASVVWDDAVASWKIASSYVDGEKAQTKLRMVQIKPSASSAQLDITAREVFIGGALRSVGLTQTALRLTQPCLLLLDRIGRLAAVSLRHLDKPPLGRPPMAPQIRVLSQSKQVFASSRFATGGRHPSNRLARESEAVVWAAGPDLFATSFAPSRSFDVLGTEFNKSQLAAVLSVLLVALIGTRSWANSTRTRQKWQESN
ncbi:hypothetical protein JCM10207_002655 [Rhodosporidiobolus poonsookiae]